ncbi:MAG: O-sialoglycoprotein endopeptidase [Cellulosilyticaceae bacterium]
MKNVLGIDTSNYTTSIGIYSEDGIVVDNRKMLSVERGKRGLRQSDALFEHIKNLPLLLESIKGHSINGVCVSTKPRPCEGSYMPVFLGGYSVASSIASSLNVPLVETSHQEGHIEAALDSINKSFKEFIAVHISGGTTEVLHVTKEDRYLIDIIGESLDISVGQLVDRVGVKMGFNFPAGIEVDSLACNATSELIIPSKVKNFHMNFSGQETMAVRFLDSGYNKEEIAYAVMKCVSKSLEKVCINLKKQYNIPIVFIGGVSSSIFLQRHFKRNGMASIHFAKGKYGADNGVGVAKIGFKRLFE